MHQILVKKRLLVCAPVTTTRLLRCPLKQKAVAIGCAPHRCYGVLSEHVLANANHLCYMDFLRAGGRNKGAWRLVHSSLRSVCLGVQTGRKLLHSLSSAYYCLCQ